jgi:hypothetical protein
MAGSVKAIDTKLVLDNAKPEVIKAVLKKNGYDPAIKYSMLGSADPMGGGAPKYTDAIAVLDKSLVKQSTPVAQVGKTAPKPTLQDALEGGSTRVRKTSGDAQLSSQSQKQAPVQGTSPELKVQTAASGTRPELRVKDPVKSSSSSYPDNTPSKLNKQSYKETFGLSEEQATKDLAELKNPTPTKKNVGNDIPPVT